jgi:hypothetical protein
LAAVFREILVSLELLTSVRGVEMKGGLTMQGDAGEERTGLYMPAAVEEGVVGRVTGPDIGKYNDSFKPES